STRVECGTTYVQTQESIAQPSIAATETTPKGKTIKADTAEPPKLKQQGRKMKVVESSAAEPPFRIYHKNRGRSERIFNQKIKKIGLGPNGEGSIADKAFSL
nr:pectin lyase-like superfamily protein [Tanacetum cinerariifolium]